MKKPLSQWTVRDLQRIRVRRWDEDIGVFDSLIILPLKEIHDSGYRCLDFVAVRKGVPICRLSGCSDVINLDGIGGYGKWDSGKGRPKAVTPKGWSIDCLKTSGLLQIFANGRLTCGSALSSFTVYAQEGR